MRAFPAACLICALLNCGGGAVYDDVSETEEESSTESINSEKLVGTPFEGLTTGDDFDHDYFLCGEYQTAVLESFPIPIFTAFFTPSEEAVIQEGIDMANAAMGFTAYEMTDSWSDGVRMIYKVNEIDGGGGGQTFAFSTSFLVSDGYDQLYNNNEDGAGEGYSVDWAIELTGRSLTYYSYWGVAHEIGHATGLSHQYFNIATGEERDLEVNAVMESDGGTELNDYNELMQIWGNLMNFHLGQVGRIFDDPC